MSFPLVVALTGGIGAGKSTVSALFSALSVPVIDADLISRELVKAGSPLLNKIITHFGQEYLDKTGNLDRQKLKDRIFAFPEDRLWLEKLLHPEIYGCIKKRIKILSHTDEKKYILCVIPLLFETGKPDFIHRVLVVDTDETAQLDRLIKRDKLTPAQAQRILDSQCSRQTRLQGADDIIENKDNIAALEAIVAKLDEKYQRLSSRSHGEPRTGHAQ